MDNWKTWTALGILAYGSMRLATAQKSKKLHSNTGETVQYSAISGNRATEDGVSTGNNMAYYADNTQIVWSGPDIYGIPAHDIKSPDGSLRRVWGEQWFMGV